MLDKISLKSLSDWVPAPSTIALCHRAEGLRLIATITKLSADRFRIHVNYGSTTFSDVAPTLEIAKKVADEFIAARFVVEPSEVDKLTARVLELEVEIARLKAARQMGLALGDRVRVKNEVGSYGGYAGTVLKQIPHTSLGHVWEVQLDDLNFDIPRRFKTDSLELIG